MIDQTSGYNLKAVIHETGLNAETLRAWERRYGLPKPERTAGGHRLYSHHDIQMLNWLSARQKEGLSISRAVELWRTLESNGQDPLQREDQLPQPVLSSGAMIDELRERWIEACMQFNEQNAENLLAQAFSLYSPETVCSQILQKGLQNIGQRWYDRESTIQQEHFATALAMRRLYNLAAVTLSPIHPGRILAACPPGEDHEFGLLLITVLLRRRGWEVIYLGANVPLIRLEATLQSTTPYLVISLAETLPSAAALLEMGEFLAVHKVHMAYGGGIINTSPSLKSTMPGHFLGAEISEVPGRVEDLWRSKPALPETVPVPSAYLGARSDYLKNIPLINMAVNEAFQRDGISPAHLEVANSALAGHTSAALRLGNMHLLENSFAWLSGLLSNSGIPELSLPRYLATYYTALSSRLSADEMSLFAGLARSA